MLSPYSGAAATTFNKMLDGLKSWTANKISLNSYGRYFYINSKGYMHIYATKRTNFNGRTLYSIADYMLTKDNQLKESGESRYFDTPQQLNDYFKEVYLDEAAWTTALHQLLIFQMIGFKGGYYGKKT